MSLRIVNLCAAGCLGWCGIGLVWLGALLGRASAAENLTLSIAIEAQTRAAVLQVSGPPGTSCQIEYTDALTASTAWVSLSNLTLGASSSTVVDRTARSGRGRFYRASRPANESGLLLWLKFDGSLTGVDGEAPLSQQGVSFQSGKVGQAVYLNGTGHIRYAVTNNLDPREGTIEFWIQPDWDGTNSLDRVFLEAGDNFNRGLYLSKDGASNLRFLLWGDDPSTPAVETSVERGLGFSGQNWVKGQWYHLAAAWKGATRELAFYLNGEVIRTEVNGVLLTSFSTTFFVLGSEIDNTHPALVALDDLRIFNRMRSAAEIWNDFQNPAEPPR